MFDKLKLKYHNYKYNKLLDKARKEEQEARQQALDFLLDEVDRRLVRSEWLITLFNNKKKCVE